MGGRLHLLLDVVGHRLRRLRHRRVLPAPGRMEGGPVDDDASRPRRAQHGGVDPPAHHPRRTAVSFGRRESRQYTSILYTERLDDVGAAPSIGTIGDGFDNAMAESVMGLFKTELHRNPAALAANGGPGRASTTSRSPSVPGCRGSTRSGSTQSSTTGRQTSSRTTTVTSLSPRWHEKTKPTSLRQTQADSNIPVDERQYDP